MQVARDPDASSWIQIQVAGDPDSSCLGSRFKLLGIQIQVAGDPDSSCWGSRFKLLGIQIQVPLLQKIKMVSKNPSIDHRLRLSHRIVVSTLHIHARLHANISFTSIWSSPVNPTPRILNSDGSRSHIYLYVILIYSFIYTYANRFYEQTYH